MQDNEKQKNLERNFNNRLSKVINKYKIIFEGAWSVESKAYNINTLYFICIMK